jgi:hypothetical protein
MTTAQDGGRNETPEDSAAELRRMFELALSDALKGDKVSAGALDVIRKYLADKDADRRWQTERDEQTPPAAPQQPDPMAGRRFPFPVNPPAAPAPGATTQSDPSRDMDPLSFVAG